MNLYALLRRWLPPAAAQVLTALCYGVLLILVYLWFFTTPGEFRYLAL